MISCPRQVSDMSKPLPFTEHSLRRAIRGVERAGKFVVGVKPDGTLIVSEKPLDVAALVPVPADAQDTPQPKRRMGDYLTGGDPSSKWKDKRA